ncbi:oligosaccharide flippase family protein [Shewanella intestini]|uniref:Oligosaccharide flippase family protein n=1 Tax=Shewanella intestini TaxID=2017544 RepID=A0ABS5HYG5_9GAMM|nr:MULTISPECIES: oligosaccharide flippase family protein [Shewanella]MBR9726818.1 oligosaccharide flippase family protein [Shewanella intestini]MRG34616.1 oligosaccharide flippase family protein [Shewanella sp. XMDDZSB0408]
MLLTRLHHMLKAIHQGFSAIGRSMLWLGSAQFSGRIVRLISSILLARLLTPEIFGQVAIILTMFELICTGTRRITSAALIRMEQEQFNAYLPSANMINFISCIIAMGLMLLMAKVLSWHYQTDVFTLPIVVMSTSFLILPWGMQYATLHLRNNQMRIVGRANLWQTIIDGLLTALLALLGFGIWAIILPKVLVIFVWLAIHRYHNPLPAPTLQQPVSLTKVTYLLRFGFPVICSDITIALRQHIDYLLIGYFMGVEALGLYFFAYNISLGVSLGIISSFGTVFYSHICHDEQANQRSKFINSTAAIMTVTVPVIAIQTLFAPWYVPLVYGEQWLNTDAVALFTFLCLSGLTRPLAEAASQLLLANGLSKLNLQFNITLTLILGLVIAVSSQISLIAIAQGVMACCLIFMPLFCFLSYQKVYKSARPISVGETL